MPPGSILYHISFRSTFTLCSLLLVFIIKIPKIFILLLLSLSDLTLASGREGIDNPFIALVARFLFVCAGTRELRVVSYWIDTLVLKTEGNTYATLLHHPFLFKGKPTQCSRGSKKDFWRSCRGDLCQVRIYQVPITTLILHITFFAIRLSFSSPPLLK